MNRIKTSLLQGTQSLDMEIWERVNLNLMAKSLSELMHEQVALPVITGREPDGLTHFTLRTDLPEVSYTFSAEQRLLDYWHIRKDSIKRQERETVTAATDVPAFFIEMQQTFGIRSFTLAHYVEELLNTLYADAYIASKGRLTAARMADADYQTVEHQMDGHPWVIVNKGRIGFDYQDYTGYAPEADQSVQLAWIAVHKSRARFHTLEGMDEQAFYIAELGEEKLREFRQVLTGLGLNAADYSLMPVHEWQWNNKILVQFAPDIARKLLVPVGMGDDQYVAQQSIRTLYNLSSPGKNYVKMAISILSTGNIRGLSPKQMAIAPRVTEWVRGMLDGDPYLQQLGLVLLGEVATVTYFHPYYTAITDPPYQYNELLGVLWRESAVSFLRPGEKIMTMAALLYVDDQWESLVGQLIRQSGLSVADWVDAYLSAYLKSLLHLYYAHSLCVTPHGENIILIMKDHVPVRMIIKDFVDDIVLNPGAIAKLPADLADKMIRSSNQSNLPLFILLGVFDAFFRYLSNVLHTYAGYEEKDFWERVAHTIMEYQQEHPDLQAQFDQFDLFAPEFPRFYINSQRLFHGYEEAAGFAIPKKGGVLQNPLAAVADLNPVILNPGQ